MKKRLLSVVLSLCLILSLLPTTVFAIDSAAISSTKSTVKAGETFDVSLVIPSNSAKKAYSASFRFYFDNTVFEVVNFTPPTIGGKSANGFNSASNFISCTYEGDLGENTLDFSGGLSVTAQFKVKDSASPGAYDFTVDGINTFALELDLTDFTTEYPLFSVPSGLKTTVTIPKSPISDVSKITAKVDAPQKGVTLDTSVDLDSATAYTGAVEWYKGDTAAGTAVTGPAAANQVYTAKITLTAKTADGESFDSSLGGKTTTEGYKIKFVDAGKLELTQTFPKTNDKDTPVCVAPTGVTATFGSALSTITLTNPTGNTAGKWYWMDNTQKVGNVKDNPHTYKAKFVPNDTANFSTVENIDVTVTATQVVLGAGYPIMIPIEVYYTGSAIEPTPTIKTDNCGDELVLNQDYKIKKYEDNTNVGTGKIYIEPLTNGNYSFTAGSYNFTIKAGTSSISITSDPSKPYDGNVVADPAVSTSGSTGAVTYTYYTDATCNTKTTAANSGAVSDGTAPKNAGDYWVKATLAADSNHSSATSAAKKFTISQKALTDSMITLGTQATYNGTEQSVQIASVKDGTAFLIATQDYTVFSGNKATDVGNNTLVIKGKGNYTGEASATWTLVAKDVTITPTSGLSKTYGAADPELTYSTDLTAGAALETAFNTAKSGVLSYTGTDVGAYPITLGSLAAGNNFNLKLAAATVNFTINKATPSITATSPRQLVKNGVEVDISNWASFDNTDSGAKLTYALDGAPAGITLTSDNKLKADPSTSTTTFNIKVNAAATTNFAAPSEKVIVVNVVTKSNAGVSITTPPTSKTYGDADFTLTATKTAPDGGTWSWNSSNPAILEIISGADTAMPTIKVKKADTAGATLTVTYTSSTHYGSANATITVAQKEVTVAAGNYKVSKEYDGTTTAGTGNGVLSVTGIVDSGVSVKATPVAYTNANVGGQSTMDVNITLDGSGNANYKIKGGAATISVPCEITAKDVKLTGGINATDRSYVKDNKTVDLTKGTLTFDGLVSGETLDVNIPATGTISDAKVGAYNVTYSGVTLKDGTTGKASNYKLVGSLPTVTVNITKATARTLADIPVSQKYTVTTGEKAIGTVMPADAGTLTYAKGTESKTGSVTIDSWAVDTTGKVTYTLSGGVAGDTVTLPVIIGSDNYENSTVNVVITLTAKDDQAALTLTGGTTVVYGETLQLGTSGGSGTGGVTYAVTNGTGQATIDASGKLTPVKVGTVKVKATKAEDANYNAITSAEVEITITRATPTGAPKYTAITTSGKTLADAGLTTTGSNLSVPGTVKWVDETGADLPNTTTVEANKLYNWVFTPNDSANYTTLTGTIVLYRASTGIVIYSPCYTIKASAGANGTISPAGWCSVVENGSQTFTFTPDKGYTVAKVLVDGKSVGAVKSYTFKNVTKDHTIEVIFMKSNGNPATGVFVMP